MSNKLTCILCTCNFVAKKKTGSSRGGRKQQTRKGGAKKKITEKDTIILPDDHKDIISDESPDLNPQDQLKEGGGHDGLPLDKELNTDKVELTTSEACPSEERMEINKEASPLLTTNTVAPSKQQKTVAGKR